MKRKKKLNNLKTKHSVFLIDDNMNYIFQIASNQMYNFILPFFILFSVIILIITNNIFLIYFQINRHSFIQPQASFTRAA